MHQRKRVIQPHFSAILLILASIISQVFGQQPLDAGVRIASSMDKAGDVSVFHFTIEVPDSGNMLRTYFPMSVLYTGAEDGSVDLCQESQFLEAIPIQNCVYDLGSNMVEFQLPDHVPRGDYFEYELGHMRNPFFSQNLAGFIFQVLDSTAPDIVLFENTDQSVRINAGALTDQSLQTESAQVAAESKFTFQFKVTNPVPAGGYIEISFPLSHFEVPSSERESRLSVSGGSWFTPDQILQSSSGIRFSVPAQGISASNVVTLEIADMTNPNTMEETDSFSLTTLTSAYDIIDTASSGFVIQVQEPAEMKVKEYSIQSKVVGKITSITVKLTLPTVYEEEGYLTVTLPSTVQINQAYFDCKYYIGFTSDSDSGQCSLVSDQVIRIDKNISQKEITFRVISIVNPANTMPTGDFVFHIFDPVDNMIASTLGQGDVRYTPIPGQLSSVSVVRPDPTVGFLASGESSAVEWTVATSRYSFLQTGEIIEFKVPYSQFSLVDNGLNIECIAISPTNPVSIPTTCTVEEYDEDYFKLRYAVTCLSICEPQSSFVLKVTAGIQNPSWIPNLDAVSSIEVTTYTSDMLYKIEQRTSNIVAQPGLEEGSISEMSLEKTTGQVGAPTDFSFTVKTLNAIPQQGYLTIEFEDNSLQLPEAGDQINCQTKDGANSFNCEAQLYASGLISGIQIYEPCGSNMECPMLHKLEISVSGVRNPQSTKPITNEFRVSTYTQEGYAIDKGTMFAADANDLNLEPAIFYNVALVEPDSDQQEIITGKIETSYLLRVQLKNELIANRGRLQIDFPEQVVIESQATGCLAYEEVSTVLLECQVMADQTPQTIVITHSNDADQDYKGQNIMVKLQNAVRNPPSTKSSDTFYVHSELLDLESGIYYPVDLLENEIVVTPNKANTFESISITRTVSEVSIETDLKVCITPNNPVPANSKLTITYPDDQAIISGQQTYRGLGSTNLMILTQESQKATVVLPESIAKLTEYCIDVSYGIMNPGKTSPPQNSFELTLQTGENFMIDETLTDIFAQPYLSAGPFLKAEIRSFGDIVGWVAQVEAELELKSQLPSGSEFFIKLPNSVFYEPVSDSIGCAINDSDYEPCNDIVKETDNQGTYISSLRIYSPTQLAVGAQVTLKVRNLRNKFDTRELISTELEALLQSYDDNGFTINTSTVTLVTPNLLANPDARIVLAERSVLEVQMPTNVELILMSKTRLLSQSLLKLHLSSFLFVHDDTNHITCSLDDASRLCTLTDEGTDFMVIQMEVDCAAQGGVCDDEQEFFVSIVGLRNRYSTSRGAEPYEEIYFETLDQTGSHQIDTSNKAAFNEDLTPGTVTMNEGSIALSQLGVSQYTDFSLTLDYPGMQTVNTDVVQINISEVMGVDESGQIFKVPVSNGLTYVRANDVSFFDSSIYKDSEGYVTSVYTPVPATDGSVTIKMINVVNLGRVRPLSAALEIFINDKFGGQIAQGTSEIVDLDILRPAYFTQVSVERMKQDLAKPTDVEVTIKLNDISIMAGSVLELIVPRDHLDLNDEGSERCKLLSISNRPWTECTIETIDNEYVLRTGPIIEGTVGSEMQLLLTNVFSNPKQVTFSNTSIRLSISNEGYAIGESDPGMKIFIDPPLSKEELEDVSVAQEGSITGQETEITFAFTLKNQVPFNSTVIFTLPHGILLYEDAIVSDMVCEARTGSETSSVDCEVIGSPESRSSPQFVQEIRIFPESSNVQDFMERGFLSEIIIKKAFNPEFVRDRSTSEELIVISIVSQNGFVAAQDSIREADMPMLTQSSVLDASMKRDSTQVGENTVIYELEFVTPNYIPSGAYALLSIPTNEIKLRFDQFDCEDVRTRDDMRCQLVETTRDDYFLIKISDLCKNRYCEVGSEIKWEFDLANSNVLIFEEDIRSIQLKFFTKEDQPIQELTSDVRIGPMLEGNRISDFEMERKYNKIGGVDYLKFFVAPLSLTIFQETNLVLELPHGIAYSIGLEMICTRELDSGESVQLGCEGVSFPDQNGQVLRSVRILNFCDQFYVCFENEPLNFAIQVRNPSTNMLTSTLNQVKLILRQIENSYYGLDIGSGQRTIELAKMTPNTAEIAIIPLGPEDNECDVTGELCYLMANVTTANTIKSSDSGAYLEIKFTRDFQIESQTCWAYVDQSTTALECFVMTSDTLHVRAPASAIAEIKDSNNRMRVIVQNVRMPLSTAPVRNPTVQNFELLPASPESKWSSSRVFSLVDTNESNPGMTQAVSLPSKFKTVEVLREKTEIGQASTLRLTMHFKHALMDFTRQEVPLMLEIYIPLSAGVLRKDVCFADRDRSVENSCQTTQETDTHNTLLVGKLNDFCPDNDLFCRIYIKDFVNGQYSIEDKDAYRDAFNFTLFYEQADGSRALIYKNAQDGPIFATPNLVPLKLSLTEIKLEPTDLIFTARETSFKMKVEAPQVGVFESPYLMTRFAAESFKPMISYMYSPTASVNGVEAVIRTIETVDMEKDTSILAIYIELPKNIIGRTIDVEFTSLKNPNFLDETNTVGKVEVQVLGNSVDRWQIQALSEAAFDTNLKASQFDSLALFSTKPWPGEQTYFEIDLSMTNQITNTNEAHYVEIELPAEFIVNVDSFTCYDFYSQSEVSCSKPSDERKILVELTNSAGEQSALSFMAASYRIGPIQNPNRVVSAEQLVNLRVFEPSTSKVYAEGSVEIYVKEKGDSSICPEGCAECASDGSCFACDKPSAAPLFNSVTQECHSICPEGSFQSGQRCLKCSNECSVCHSLDQCSSCYSQPDKVFVDGRCLDQCPDNTVEAFLTEDICVRAPSNPDNNDGDTEFPIFQLDDGTLSDCSAENCQDCGLSGQFCAVCQEGFSRYDGKCEPTCKDGFFSTQGVCYKCSPMCQSCSGTANRCDTCYESGADFAFYKLLKDQQLCASVCPPGTFEEDGVCEDCSDSCNTCSGTADQCTSCFHSKASKNDLYFVESEKTCQETCPMLTEINLKMHTCEPIVSDIFSISSWPMILLAASIVFPLSMLGLSKIVSGQAGDSSWELASALYSLVESIVKASFWIALWESQNFILFCTTGVSMLCSALLAVIFYESTFLPVLEALDDQRNRKGVETTSNRQKWATRIVRFMACLSSINTMHLLSSGFCGIKALRMDLSYESPCFYLKRRVQANKVQMLLTSVWTAAAVASMFTAGLAATAVGAGFTSTIVSIISLSLQVKLHLADRSFSAGYRSLQTHD